MARQLLAVLVALHVGGCGAERSSTKAAEPAPVATQKPVEEPAVEEPAAQWRTLPATESETAEFLTAVCQRLDQGDEAWLDEHVQRPLVGHEPFTNPRGTYTWDTATALIPTDPTWNDSSKWSFCA